MCAHNNCMSCPSIWATLSTLLDNSLLGSFQLFLHSDQPLSEGWNNPVQRCLPVGGGSCIIHAGGGGGFTRWRQTALVCNRRRPAATSSRRASFSGSIRLTLILVYIERSNITLTHLHVSNCRVRQLRFSGIFVALGFGNGYHGND